MYSVLSLPISTDSTVLVHTGDSVIEGMPLAKGAQNISLDSLPLAKILEIPTKAIPKYLTVPLESKLKKGDVLARRKKLFSQITVSAPYDCYISAIDLMVGSIQLRQATAKGSTLTSPLPGKVKHIRNNSIDIEFKGSLIQGQKGSGWAKGHLYFVDGAHHLYTFDTGVAGKIVVLPALDAATGAKLRALEAVGIVSQVGLDPFIPFVVISPEAVKQLYNYHGKPAILNGHEHYLVISE